MTRPHETDELAARAQRHRLGLGVEPINIWEQIERSGVPLSRHGFGKTGADGLYFRQGDVPVIVVNADKEPSRQRWTAAHELGHHVMHAGDRGDFLITDRDVLLNQDATEKEANGFAAYLLAPTEAVLDAWTQFADGHPSPIAVVRSMSRFGISYQAMLWRLLNAGAIDEQTRATLEQDGRGRVNDLKKEVGYDERAAFPVGPSLPAAALVDPALAAWSEFSIAEDKLAQLLRTSVPGAMEHAKDRGIARPDLPPHEEVDLDALLDDATDFPDE